MLILHVFALLFLVQALLLHNILHLLRESRALLRGGALWLIISVCHYPLDRDVGKQDAHIFAGDKAVTVEVIPIQSYDVTHLIELQVIIK